MLVEVGGGSLQGEGKVRGKEGSDPTPNPTPVETRRCLGMS